jgi:membrane-associated phospholipid phosphatase
MTLATRENAAATRERTPDESPTGLRRHGPALRRALREVLLVGLLFMAYKAGRIVADGHVAEAMANAWHVWDLERAVGLPAESGLQHLLLQNHFLVRAANCYYAYVHFPATAAVLIWMYLRRQDYYRWTRRTLAFLTAAALVVHLLLPLAPPRMLTTIGMIDTGKLYGPAVYGSPSTDTLTNQYAAMPSLHVGWALALAIALIVATRSRWRWLWLAHPLVTLLVVVGTGNHYWLDAIVAVVLLGVVLLLLPRPRPALKAPVVPAPRRPDLVKTSRVLPRCREERLRAGRR